MVAEPAAAEGAEKPEDWDPSSTSVLLMWIAMGTSALVLIVTVRDYVLHSCTVSEPLVTH